MGSKDRKLNIALAEFRRNRVYMIFGLAKVEQCNVTFAQTESILNGTIASHISTSDVEILINLKRAHAFLTEKLVKKNFEPTVKTLCDVHNLVAAGEALEWGNIRGTGQEQHYTPGVRLQGGDVINPIPTSEPKKITAALEAAVHKFSQSNKQYVDGITLFCDLTRIQAFFDGNKRTALLFTNALLASGGINPLTIPVDKMPDFNAAVGELFQDNRAPMMLLLSEEYLRAYPDFT